MEMEMGFLKWQTTAAKAKQWTCLHDQRVNKNIATTSVKKKWWLRSKQAIKKCSIKKADKTIQQATITLKATCLL